MKKLTVCRSAIATTEESESETFAVRRVKTRPSVTSSRTIESRPFKFTSRLARNGGRSRPTADYGNANSRNPRVFAKVARKSSLAVETRRNFSLPDRFHHHAVRDHHPIFDRARQKARQA